MYTRIKAKSIKHPSSPTLLGAARYELNLVVDPRSSSAATCTCAFYHDLSSILNPGEEGVTS